MNSYRKLSTAELKQKAWPLQQLVSQSLQQQGPDRQQCVNQNTRVPIASVVGSSTFHNSGFPQPLTYASSSHHLHIWLYTVIKKGKSTTWLSNCSENSSKAVIYFLSVKCVSSAFFSCSCLLFLSQIETGITCFALGKHNFLHFLCWLGN